MKKNRLTTILFFLLSLIMLPVLAQKRPDMTTDSNTPLHLIEPEYNVPYGIPEK